MTYTIYINMGKNSGYQDLFEEKVKLFSDSLALYYAADFIASVNQDSTLDADSIDSVIDYLDNTNTSNGNAFCVAIIEGLDRFIYGDENILEQAQSDVDLDDNLTEAIIQENSKKKGREGKFELYYPELEFVEFGEQRDADDWDDWERSEPWEYEVDLEDLYELIWDICISEDDFPRYGDEDFDPNDPDDWEEYESWLDENFDKIYDKYEKQILDFYEKDAIEDAEANYNHEDYIDWDSIPGGRDYWGRRY